MYHIITRLFTSNNHCFIMLHIPLYRQQNQFIF